MKTSKEAVKKKPTKPLAIKMKNKQKNQQSPTDKATPSESAPPLTSKLQSPTNTKSAKPSLTPDSRRSSPRNKKSSDKASPYESAPLTSKLQTSKDTIKMKDKKKFAIKMKNKQNTQQSPTDKTSPFESASLTSKLQTPPKTKSAEPSLSPESRRSSPRNKKLAEDNVEPSPNTMQLRRTPRNRKLTEPSVVVSPTKCVTTSKHHRQLESELSSPTTKRQATRKKNVQSQSKSSKGDDENSGVGRKNVKRKLDTSSTGTCLNVQLRDPNDTLADLQEEEEEEEENLRTRKAVEEDNSNHVEPDVEEENDNSNDDEPELENGNSSDNEEGEEGKEAKKRKYVPRGPTQMHALKLDSVEPKRTVSFNTNEQPMGNPSVQLAGVLRVLVRKLPLTFRDWRRVPIEAKENIWKIVLSRFIVSECYKDYYFSKMGAYLREARSRKAGLVIDALDWLQGEERNDWKS
ncbi:TNF receptor-associated factor family protein DDB_G0272098-like [Papaver somniferum]|uniref:TNF receptor-associated factor family protein DDB_G0272098-like n=1 Tax=Papaver somniferum TaxID=3469 RepID=UPI000E70372C|nr:TNF receptor-associated factor family protein DDB_G0272098-like [Papaver somniferum]